VNLRAGTSSSDADAESKAVFTSPSDTGMAASVAVLEDASWSLSLGVKAEVEMDRRLYAPA